MLCNGVLFLIYYFKKHFKPFLFILKAFCSTLNSWIGEFVVFWYHEKVSDLGLKAISVMFTYLLDPHQIPAISRVHLAVLTRGDTRPAGPMSKAADIFYFCICSSQKDFSPNEVQFPKNHKTENGRHLAELRYWISPKKAIFLLKTANLKLHFFVSAIKYSQI